MSETTPTEVTGTVLCEAVAEICRCREPAGHEPGTAHVCPCGGSWRGAFESGDFEVVTFPAPVPRPDLPAGGVW